MKACSSAPSITSPANRLCRKRVNLAVLVDRDHIPLFRTPARQQVHDEVQPMAAHDHGLSAAPRLNPEALRDPPRDVCIERRRTHIACPRRQACASHDSISSRVMSFLSSTCLCAALIRAYP